MVAQIRGFLARLWRRRDLAAGPVSGSERQIGIEVEVQLARILVMLVVAKGVLDVGSADEPDLVAQQIDDLEDGQRLSGCPVVG
jgi:hypothetical protein